MTITSLPSMWGSKKDDIADSGLSPSIDSAASALNKKPHTTTHEYNTETYQQHLSGSIVFFILIRTQSAINHGRPRSG